MELMLFLAALAMAGIGIYFLGPSITGFVIREFSYADDLNLVVTSSGNYTWQLKDIGDLKYARLDGRVTNYGKARVYLESNGIRYLVFDSARLNETNEIAMPNKTSLITGFAVKDDSNKTESDKNKEEKNHKPQWTGANEFFINGTTHINLSGQFSDEDNDPLIYSASEAE